MHCSIGNCRRRSISMSDKHESVTPNRLGKA
jgi:hypothetical protein